MEPRKITVISTLTQSKYVFMSAATTLEELKIDLDKENIVYTDMVFHEGLSKTQLLSDQSILPTNIEYKGEITNELIFRLTLPHKKYDSGIYTLNRAEINATIKKLHLEAKCIERFGVNYTICKNDKLIELINEATNSPSVLEHKETQINTPITPVKYVIDPDNYDPIDIINTLKKDKVITAEQHLIMLDSIIPENKLETAYSDDDINDLFYDF